MNIENLKALVHGRHLTAYQRGLALNEFERLVSTHPLLKEDKSEDKPMINLSEFIHKFTEAEMLRIAREERIDFGTEILIEGMKLAIERLKKEQGIGNNDSETER